MQDQSHASAPTVGDVVEITAPGCGPADMCGCDLHLHVGHQGRIERIQISTSGVLDLYFVEGVTPAWFDDEFRIVERAEAVR